MANDWQPIETAPRDGKMFLVVNNKGRVYLAHYYKNCFAMVFSEGCGWRFGGKPAFWQPLPDPPKEVK